MTTLSTGSKPKEKPKLRFDADQHRYWLGDRELPSVTTVLKSAGLIDTSRYAAGDSALRGTYVHEAIAMPTLDLDALDDRLRGYVEAWRAFMDKNEVYVVAREERIHNSFAGYAGTLDCLSYFHGARWVLDIKTGSPERWHGLQTIAYDACVWEVCQRAAVYLKPDGTYKFVVHDDPDDWTVFLAALNIHNWKGKR